VVICSETLEDDEIVIVKAFEAVCFGEEESDTSAVKLAGPAAVGVPEMIPLLLRLRPAGRFPEETVQPYGALPPEAESVVEYATPVVPPGKLDVLTAIGDGMSGLCPLGPALDTPAHPALKTQRTTIRMNNRRAAIRL
jgi:hypothetical protein